MQEEVVIFFFCVGPKCPAQFQTFDWQLQHDEDWSNKKKLSQIPPQTPDTVILQKFFDAAEPQGISLGGKKWLWKYCHLITRITKQATWEPEPREYRTLDLGNIRLICLFCVYVCITLAITIHLFLKIYYYHILASPCYTMLICFKSQTLAYMK